MTPQPQVITATESGRGIETRAAAIERFLDRHEVAILTAWSIVYFAGTMLRALGKAFWYDEILTLLEARQPTLQAAMRAFGDVDWMPPLSHLTFYWTDKLLGPGEVAFRIPVMIAFWVFCLCLYFFARRRVSIFYALMALLLPFASAYQSYSYEARSYAFLLGFCGIAMLSWQRAAEGAKRPWWLAGLVIGIAGALAFQYWAVLIYLPLAGAEVYRSIRRRRIDWPMWIAFICGSAPLLLFLPLILHGVSTWHSYVGMMVHPRSYITSYEIGFRASLAFFVPAVLLLAVWLLAGGSKEEPAGQQQPEVPEYEWVALAILLLLPVVAISIALIVPPHSYAPRYSAPVVAGYALLGSLLTARFAGKRASIGLACVIAALAPFLYLMASPRHPHNPFNSQHGLRQMLKNGPVAFEDRIPYLQLWYYAPASLKPRLICITDPYANDTVALNEFDRLGVPLVRYRDFVHPGMSFFFYADRREKKSRFIRAIEQDGGTVEKIEPAGRRTLMLAHLK
jgi:hypothetical protein